MLLQRCWRANPTERPSVDLVLQVLNGAPLPSSFRPQSEFVTAIRIPAVVPATTRPSGSQSTAGVDVEAILAAKASRAGLDLHWQSSIVDLLKLLGLNSGLAARGKLGERLGVREGPNGSAKQNMALHAAVMRKLAEHGGRVPDSMRV